MNAREIEVCFSRAPVAHEFTGEVLADVNGMGNWIRGLELLGSGLQFSLERALASLAPQRTAVSVQTPQDKLTVTYDEDANAGYLYLPYAYPSSLKEDAKSNPLLLKYSYTVGDDNARFRLAADKTLISISFTIPRTEDPDKFVHLFMGSADQDRIECLAIYKRRLKRSGALFVVATGMLLLLTKGMPGHSLWPVLAMPVALLWLCFFFSTSVSGAMVIFELIEGPRPWLKKITPRPLSEREAGWVRDILRVNNDWQNVDISNTEVVAEGPLGEGVAFELRAPQPQNPKKPARETVGNLLIETQEGCKINVELVQSEGSLEVLYVICVDRNDKKQNLPAHWVEKSREAVDV